MSEDKTFEFAGVNPCAEETLPAFGSCNLSSINLSEFVRNPFANNAEFDLKGFAEMVRNGVIYLNEVLDENMKLHPLPQQREVSQSLRQIGLGIMGQSDMFIKMGIKYGSEESIELIHKIGRTMINEALRQSALLAKEKGTFPLYKADAVLKSPFLLSNADKARNYFDKVIASRGLIPLKERSSGQALTVNHITNERYKEFIGEGQTFYNMKRLNLDFVNINAQPVQASKAVYVLPIPTEEIDYRN